MKKHLAVILSILALLISLASVGLSYYWRQQTIRDIKISSLDLEIKIREEQLESLERQGKASNQIFCLLGVKESCEKQQ